MVTFEDILGEVRTIPKWSLDDRRYGSIFLFDKDIPIVFTLHEDGDETTYKMTMIRLDRKDDLESGCWLTFLSDYHVTSLTDNIRRDNPRAGELPSVGFLYQVYKDFHDNTTVKYNAINIEESFIKDLTYKNWNVSTINYFKHGKSQRHLKECLVDELRSRLAVYFEQWKAWNFK